MKKILYTIAGCVLIALSYNIFFLPYDLVSNGVFGIGALLNYETNYDPALFIFLINITFLVLAYSTLGKIKTKEYLLPSFLIPLLIFATYSITDYFDFDYMEPILIVIIGSFLTGLGYGLLYKEGQSVGGFDVMQDILNSVKIYRSKKFIYGLEGLIIIGTLLLLNTESMLYSAIAMLIIHYLATKAKIGISTSKTFFIITQQEQAVKKYIIEELKHDLTEFSVKGGYSHDRSKILMTAIDTKDYYRLKEGIALIDPQAFISIVDSYEVINKNIALNKGNKSKADV